MKRGVTLVELLLAMAIALIGITTVLLLAADVIGASARIRQKNLASAPARATLERIKNEIISSSTFSGDINGIATTQGAQGKVRWQVATLDGIPALVRLSTAAAPTRQNIVVSGIRQISLQQDSRAITLSATLGTGQHRQKVDNVIRRWGQTL